MGFSAGLQFTQQVQETKSFSYKISKLAQALSEHGHGVLILVDELRADSAELRELVITYQELVGAGLNVAIVLAGLPGAVSGTLNDKVLTFLNRARKVNIPPLDSLDVEAFYAEAFAALSVEISSELLKKASEDADGSPYMMQLIGHAVARTASPDIPVSPEQYGSALASAVQDFENDVCGTTLASLSDKDRAFLFAMAHDDGPSKLSDISARMGVTPDYAQQYRRRLIDGGVIKAARFGYVEFAVPYLSDHLKRELESGC